MRLHVCTLVQRVYSVAECDVVLCVNIANGIRPSSFDLRLRNVLNILLMFDAIFLTRRYFRSDRRSSVSYLFLTAYTYF